MTITKHKIVDRGLIPELFNGTQRFFGDRLTISVLPYHITENGLRGNVSVTICICDDDKISQHSNFVMEYGFGGGWYDIAIRPIELISSFWELTEIDHPTINYDLVAKYIYGLLNYLSDDIYPNISDTCDAVDPNAISYYMEIGDQIEAYIKDIYEAQEGTMYYEQQFINQAYLSNAIRLIQETTCRRGVLTLSEDGDLMTFCDGIDYTGKINLFEVVCTNAKYDYLCIYTFNNDFLITDFILPIIDYINHDSEEFANDGISVGQLKEYFASLYSIQVEENAMTPSMIITDLKKQVRYNRVLQFIIDNNKSFKQIFDTISEDIELSTKKQAENKLPFHFKIVKLAPDKLENDFGDSVGYTILLCGNTSDSVNPYNNVSSLCEAMLNDHIHEVSSAIINDICAKDQYKIAVLKDTSTLPVKQLSLHSVPNGMIFNTLYAAGEWLNKVVIFSANVANDLITKYGITDLASKQWRNRAIDSLPSDNIIQYLIDKMLKSEVSPEEYCNRILENVEHSTIF